MLSKDLFYLLFITLVCAVFWISSSIYNVFYKTTITELDQTIIRPIMIEDFDREFLQTLNSEDPAID